ncbi:MAG: cation diffusion facilitator family transporter [Chloroflexi bacterium]|nr:cation diffusion facilitator family transporter [Chloroflexota bacterium]
MSGLESAARTAKSRQALVIVFMLTLIYLVIQIIGGIITNSLALLADAAHMLTDAGGIALALFAAWIAQKPASPSKTYGYYRVEILAAFIHAVALLGSAVFILAEAYRRFQQPPEVTSSLMLVIAVVGLIVNLIGAHLRHSHEQESLNLQGAFLEVVSDALGSLGVIAAAVVMWFTGWYYADPIASIAVSLFIFPRTWKLLRQAVDILLESTPAHINLAAVQQRIESVNGVADVHDLHVWSITSGYALVDVRSTIAQPSQTEDVFKQVLNAVNHPGVHVILIAETQSSPVAPCPTFNDLDTALDYARKQIATSTPGQH